MEQKVPLCNGTNYVSLLSVMVGLPVLLNTDFLISFVTNIDVDLNLIKSLYSWQKRIQEHIFREGLLDYIV